MSSGSRADVIVCGRCGRHGHRGFVIMRGNDTDHGRWEYACCGQDQPMNFGHDHNPCDGCFETAAHAIALSGELDSFREALRELLEAAEDALDGLDEWDVRGKARALLGKDRSA